MFKFKILRRLLCVNSLTLRSNHLLKFTPQSFLKPKFHPKILLDFRWKFWAKFGFLRGKTLQNVKNFINHHRKQRNKRRWDLRADKKSVKKVTIYDERGSSVSSPNAKNGKFPEWHAISLHSLLNFNTFQKQSQERQSSWI